MLKLSIFRLLAALFGPQFRFSLSKENNSNTSNFLFTASRLFRGLLRACYKFLIVTLLLLVYLFLVCGTELLAAMVSG